MQVQSWLGNTQGDSLSESTGTMYAASDECRTQVDMDWPALEWVASGNGYNVVCSGYCRPRIGAAGDWWAVGSRWLHARAPYDPLRKKVQSWAKTRIALCLILLTHPGLNDQALQLLRLEHN